MRVAVMQPYIFPYIGYFQLVRSVDAYVFYDDVNFIKKGWINRNRILYGSEDKMFTIPLAGASQNRLIMDIDVLWDDKGINNFLTTLEQAYKKAPFFSDIFPLVQSIMQKKGTIADLTINSIEDISRYLGFDVKFHRSSQDFSDSRGLPREDRLIAITKQLSGEDYINMPGGKSLYEKPYFLDKQVNLHFINPAVTEYRQFNNNFVPGLSIIDVLMFNDKATVYKMTGEYKLD